MPLASHPPRLASATAGGAGGAACTGGGSMPAVGGICGGEAIPPVGANGAGFGAACAAFRSSDFRLVTLLDISNFCLIVLLDAFDFALQLFDLIVDRRRCLRERRHRQRGASQADRHSKLI